MYWNTVASKNWGHTALFVEKDIFSA